MRYFLTLLCLFGLYQRPHLCYFDDGDYHFSFFEPRVSTDLGVRYLLDYEPRLWRGRNENFNHNLSDWQQQIGQEVRITDLEQLIYQTPIERIYKYGRDRKSLELAAANNSVLQAWQKDRQLKKEMADYLCFAKEAALHTGQKTYSWDLNEKERKKQTRLLTTGEEAADNARLDFIRQRYGFQLVRLAFYTLGPKSCAEYFDRYFAQGPKNYIYYRALEYKAGGEEGAKASHGFAAVFTHCADRRASSLNSFAQKLAANWEEGLALCETEEEKAAFYSMRALVHGGNISKELERVLKINPNSPLAELLLARLFEHMEGKAFKYGYNEYKNYPEMQAQHRQELASLEKQLEQQLAHPNLDRPQLWQLAMAYVQLFGGNFDEAMRLTSKENYSDQMQAEAARIHFVAQLASLETLDMGAAAQLWKELERNPFFKDQYQLKQFTQEVFAGKFYKQGDYARAFLVQNPLRAAKDQLSEPLLSSFEQFVNKARWSNYFDNYLLEKRIGENAVDQIKEMRGVYHLQRFELDKAISALSSCSKDFQASSPSFNSSYLDKSIFSSKVNPAAYYFDIEQQNIYRMYEEHAFLAQDYNLLSFAKTLKKLKEKAESNIPQRGEYAYILAQALYNIGPAGWHRPAIYYSSDNGGHSAWYDFGKEEKLAKSFAGASWERQRYYNPDLAIKYVEIGLKAADINDELAAQLNYLGAQIELSRPHILGHYWDWEDNVKKSKHKDYLKALKQYKGSNFEREVLNECYYYRAL